MKIVIADTGVLISLGHIGYIDLIEKVFGKFYIAEAVWVELNDYDNPDFNRSILPDLKTRVMHAFPPIEFFGYFFALSKK